MFELISAIVINLFQIARVFSIILKNQNGQDTLADTNPRPVVSK